MADGRPLEAYDVDEVAKHNTAKSLWLIIN